MGERKNVRGALRHPAACYGLTLRFLLFESVFVSAFEKVGKTARPNRSKGAFYVSERTEEDWMEKSTGVLPLFFSVSFSLSLPLLLSLRRGLFLSFSLSLPPSFLTFSQVGLRVVPTLPSFSLKKKRDAQNGGEE